MKTTMTIVLAVAMALVTAACAAPATTETPTNETPTNETPSASDVLHFDGYDITGEGLAAYVHDLLFAGEDPEQVRIFCHIISQPDVDPRQGDVPVELWEIEEAETPGALEKYGVRLVPGQKADPATANVPHELALDECVRIGG